MEWQRRTDDGRFISLDSPATRHSGSAYTLNMKNLTFEDFSIYVCKAKNDLEETEESIEVSGKDR